MGRHGLQQARRELMSASFVMSSPTWEGLADVSLPEVAFLGRSNVGKSSLLGKVLGSPSIVRTSRTPGRTQLLNLFILEDKLSCVDLPGYGYAKLAKTQRALLTTMVQGYLAKRRTLQVLVLLIDARRDEVTELDKQVAEFALQHGRRLVIALTKIDLVPKPRRLHQARLLEKSLGVPVGLGVPCSAKSGEGIKTLMGCVRDALL